MISISGATGFVGTNLISYLKGFELCSIGRSDLATISSSTLKNAEAVIHLAGKAHDLKKVSDPQAYYQVNFELTKKLYDAFLKSDAQKFIFISSVKAAADSVNGILTEDTTPNPKTDYGKSKLMAEQYIQGQPLPAGKSYYILRPCMIHGPGNKGNLNLLYQFVKKGIPYPLAGFENKRSFLSVENLCFIIKELIKRDDVASGVYQIADDESLSTNDVVGILSDSINKKPKLWKIPPGLIRTGARLGDVLHLPLTTERLDKLTESYIASNQKIKHAIGKDLPLTSRKGLAVTAASFAAK
ncbi:NAD-dependent epimerase/dehydratase family protein [Mucilaginibacter jinjuensis]|uniref:NAD-dependent epimerase/dehydratase family protein n=1 Tax=Mucilaginibacter jinjuensis TaxID=1176721 RepID=A0ABY7TA03_9SPHI|nr:NAD-dependent epimerase/dehydratase family protein [Mucilaginibacter jinjuensis]WCT13172.1 NAD-dependent epimerase/dehydratase family protein [Mucilaginibacter jinjuensis]